MSEKSTSKEVVLGNPQVLSVVASVLITLGRSLALWSVPFVALRVSTVLFSGNRYVGGLTKRCRLSTLLCLLVSTGVMVTGVLLCLRV